MELLTKGKIINNSWEIKEIPAVYFLIDENEIIYIGMTKNLIPRLSDHMYDKSFNKVYWEKITDPKSRTILEKKYIRKYKPKLNKDYSKTKHKNKEKDKGESLFWNLPKVSEELNVSVRTLRKYIEDGDLKAYKIGNRIKVKPEDLNDFIESRKV